MQATGEINNNRRLFTKTTEKASVACFVLKEERNKNN